MAADGGFGLVAPSDLRRVDSHPDHWYPLAWSEELRPGKVIARRLMGEPVALYRSAPKTRPSRLFALEDRCAHRQVPLSMGVVQGEGLRCGYHGWAYDGVSGRCTDVPYLGKERLPNGVRSYPVAEVDGMIFVFPGDRALAPARLPTSLGSKADRSYKTRQLNRELACHYTFCHENLFDMNHQFLHRKQMGMIKAKCLGRRSGPDWCEVDYTFSRTEGRGTVGESAILGLVSRAGKPEAVDKTRTDGDGDLMTIRTEYPYQRLRVWVGQGDPALDVWLCYTPTDREQRANRTFGYLSVKRPPVPGVIDALWPFVTWFTEKIFEEDKEIMELEQAAHDAQGADWNHEVFPAIRDLRDVLRRNGVARDVAPVALAAE
jgi:phenylpropionate dioxygenase-like ring-hydroxylating dioxygenase large terminal subunit